ncbi:BglG family transcription antiterminator [Caldanaerobius polysaccharolyticus]|uniref:BglG family transcription antiterminator n=1 Tax=Caldanaerobius polysaccharolyticus TaxID=44256 RepID=UPI0009FD2D59|nr:PRD domain-containing protein [Caldanaerobius polysaccharolyticus]
MGKLYEILKPLSNNVVVAEKGDDIYVLLGKGIGFGKKKGDVITEEKKIEERYIKIDPLEKNNYRKVLQDIKEEVLAVSEEIIAMAESVLGESLNSHIHVGLADHIDFAIKRVNEGIEIVNPFMYEIQVMYPKEYQIAQRGLSLIKERLNVELPESEIGFIALHIHSARVNQDVSESLKRTRLIKDITDKIRELLHVDMDKKSMEMSRLISHLRYSIDRIEAGKPLENVLLPSVKRQLKREFKIAQRICEYISEKLGKEVPEEEVGYLALHIRRLI